MLVTTETGQFRTIEERRERALELETCFHNAIDVRGADFLVILPFAMYAIITQLLIPFPQ